MYKVDISCIPIQGLIKSHEDLGNIQVERFVNKDSLNIYTYNWYVEEQKGHVIFAHGITSHALFEFLEINHKKKVPIIPQSGIIKRNDENKENCCILPKKLEKLEGTKSMSSEIPKISNSGVAEDSKCSILKLQKNIEESNKASFSEIQDISVCSDNECNNLPLLKHISLDNLNSCSEWYLSYESSIVQHLNDLGLSVSLLDLQGHGKSDCWKNYACNVENFDNFCLDLIQFSLLLRQKSGIQNLPIYFLGISMGGGIVLRTLEIYREILFKHHNMHHKPSSNKCFLETVSSFDKEFYTLNISGAISLCPCLSVESSAKVLINRYLVFLAPIVTNLFPNLRVASIVQHPQHDYIKKMREIDQHNLYKHNLPVRISTEVLNIGEKIYNNLPFVYDKPSLKPLRILLIHSKLDTVCEASGSIKFFNLLKGHTNDVNVLLLDNMWHALLAVPEKIFTVNNIIEWFQARI